MTVHQYQNILKTISHKLAEAGHYDLSADEMNSEQNSKNGSESAVAENGLLKLVDAKFTSRTCSACGCVHESDCEPLYEKLLPELRCVDGRWQVTCPNGAILKLPREVFYLWMGKEKHIVTDDELRPLEEKIKTNSLSKTKKADLFRLLRNHLLQFRPAQSVFRCLNCGHVTQADFQAALNTARRWLYYTETTDKDWQAWYQQKLATVWHK